MKLMLAIILFFAAFQCCFADELGDAEAQCNTLQKNIQDLQRNPQGFFRLIDGETNYLDELWEINGKVLQVLPDGILVTTHSSADYSLDVSMWNSVYSGPQILLLNYGHSVVDEDRLFCKAKKIGAYSYQSIAGATLTINKFDCGTEVQPSMELLDSKITEIKGELSTNAFWIQMQANRPPTPEEIAAAKAKADAVEKIANERALKYNQEQADKGDPFGLIRMGERYRDGDGVPKNLAKARDYFTKAIAAGETDAADELSKMNQSSSTNAPTTKQ